MLLLIIKLLQRRHGVKFYCKLIDCHTEPVTGRAIVANNTVTLCQVPGTIFLWNSDKKITVLSCLVWA